MNSPISPEELNFSPSPKVKGAALLLVALGLVTAFFSFQGDAPRTWIALLVNAFYAVSLALAGAFFVAVQHLTKAGWSAVLRRIPEAMSSYLPLGALSFAVFYFGIPTLYHWSDPAALQHDAVLASKAAYLNPTALWIRTAIFFAIWIIGAGILRRYSRQQDADGHTRWTDKNIAVSAIFIIFFAFTFSMASYDWIMSIEPHWYSTIFGVYSFSGLFLSGLATITLIVLALRRTSPLKTLVTENHLHDLGKFVFAFSTFWAYIWFSQFMLIWYSNIPEEVTYFRLRFDNGWTGLFLVNFALNWIVPFLALIGRPAKRKPKVLGAICVLVLIAHWLDLYIMVAPGVGAHHHPRHPALGWQELGITLGFVGLFTLSTLRALGRAPLVPLRDPYLEESLHHHQ